MSDTRKQDLEHWLSDCLDNQAFELSLLKGDASFRRYYRLQTEQSPFIVMDAPPAKESIHSFIASTDYLTALKLPVPGIHFKNSTLGALVLTDFGDTDLSQSIKVHAPEKLYHQAIEHLITLQAATPSNSLAQFNYAFMRQELDIFEHWYLNCHKEQQTTAHQECYNHLLTVIETSPYTVIHRDYHSRNLMHCADGKLGIIDHQDMMIGPILYDLVSLLKDCYIPWDSAFVQTMCAHYQGKCGHNIPDFERLFVYTGIQRHLKAIGIFARLYHRDSNANFLQYIPHTLSMITQAARPYPELKPLLQLIEALK